MVLNENGHEYDCPCPECEEIRESPVRISKGHLWGCNCGICRFPQPDNEEWE